MQIVEITSQRQKYDGSRRHGGRGRLYVHLQGETILQQLEARRHRPYTIFRKEILPEVAKKYGLSKINANWSQYAGCTCPCSPGFILNDDEFFGMNVWVTVK